MKNCSYNELVKKYNLSKNTMQRSAIKQHANRKFPPKFEEKDFNFLIRD